LKNANEDELSKYRQETERLCTIAAKEKKDRILANARMAASRQETETKRNLLNRVIEKTAEKIKGLSEEEYLALMEGLIIASVKTGSEEIVVGKKEKYINESFVRRVNQKLADKGNLRLAADKADIDAGFILRQGRQRINAALDVMLKSAAQQLEGKLAEQLFG
jgi:vacuolar-type H+-ATPase subunit E/Vma4